jgi:lipoyl(octanoyl) transferase
MEFVDLGMIPFEEAFSFQETAVEQIAEKQQGEVVFLLEHPPTYTIGRSGLSTNQLATEDFEGHPIRIHRLNRGGDITFHGPGQLVGYPHLDLRLRRRDVHRYLRDLEEMLMRSVKNFGVVSYRREGLTGIWTDQGKLASIGVGIRRWITMHGFALNVSTELRYFELINPCGIEDCPVTSIEKITGQNISMESAKAVITEEIRSVFSVNP